MSPFDADLLLERRRLRRRLVVWRVAAGVLLLALVALALSWLDPRFGAGAHIARIEVEGIIVEDEYLQEALLDLARDDSARALILYVNSPGGSTYGGEQLYRAVRRVADRKPVVAVIGTLGTSAGYLAAVAGDRVLARETSITGSIGVLFQTAEFSGLLDKIGVTAESITSAPLKDEPSPFRKMSPEGRQNIQGLVDETHRWFVELVAERRQMPREKAARLASGSVYTGRTALAEGLVDALGGEREARAWLAEAHGIALDTPVRDVEYGPPDRLWRDMVSGAVRKAFSIERLTLDGLVSLWHPER